MKGPNLSKLGALIDEAKNLLKQIEYTKWLTFWQKTWLEDGPFFFKKMQITLLNFHMNVTLVSPVFLFWAISVLDFFFFFFLELGANTEKNLAGQAFGYRDKMLSFLFLFLSKK